MNDEHQLAGKRLLTLEEAGILLRRHEREVRRLISEGHLTAVAHPSKRRGRPRKFIRSSEIERYLDCEMQSVGPTPLLRRRRERRGALASVEQFV